jgi:hypothetical protein
MIAPYFFILIADKSYDLSGITSNGYIIKFFFFLHNQSVVDRLISPPPHKINQWPNARHWNFLYFQIVNSKSIFTASQ